MKIVRGCTEVTNVPLWADAVTSNLGFHIYCNCDLSFYGIMLVLSDALFRSCEQAVGSIFMTIMGLSCSTRINGSISLYF